MPIINTAEVYQANVMEAVRDKAEDICIASGQMDVFVDIEHFEDAIDLELDESPESKEILEIIEKARAEHCQYIHFF